VLVVFIRIRIGVPLDEHRIGDLLRRDALLARAGNMVEEKGLDNFNGLVAVDLQVALGQAVNLSLAGLVSPIVRLPLRLDGHQPGMHTARVLLVPNSLIEQFPEADEFAALVFNLVLQGLMHEMDRGAGRGQLVGDRPQDLDGRFMEREEVAKVRLTDAIGPGESAFVMEIIIANGGRVCDLSDARQHNVIIIPVLFEQLHQLQPVIGNDVLDPHLAFDSLLGRADGPHGQVVDFRQPVG